MLLHTDSHPLFVVSPKPICNRNHLVAIDLVREPPQAELVRESYKEIQVTNINVTFIKFIYSHAPFYSTHIFDYIRRRRYGKLVFFGEMGPLQDLEIVSLSMRALHCEALSGGLMSFWNWNRCVTKILLLYQRN